MFRHVDTNNVSHYDLSLATFMSYRNSGRVGGAVFPRAQKNTFICAPITSVAESETPRVVRIATKKGLLAFSPFFFFCFSLRREDECQDIS